MSSYNSQDRQPVHPGVPQTATYISQLAPVTWRTCQQATPSGPAPPSPCGRWLQAPPPIAKRPPGSSSGPAPSSSPTSSASSPSLRLRLRPEAEVGARLGWNAESGGRSSQWAAALPSGREAGPARVLG